MRDDGDAGGGELRRAGETFPADLASAGRARTFVGMVCRRWGLPSVVPDAEIVTTELVENAVRHSRSSCEVTLELRDGTLTIGVSDGGRRPPHVMHPDSDQAGGRGLLLIKAISEDWGFERTDGGKLVWAELALDGAADR